MFAQPRRNEQFIENRAPGAWGTPINIDVSYFYHADQVEQGYKDIRQ